MHDRNIRQRLLGLLFPSNCLLCEAPSQTTLGICTPCYNDLPRNNSACVRCAQPLPSSSHQLSGYQCGQCLQSAPPFQSSFCPYLYSYPMAQLITRYKYRCNFTTGQVLENLLWQALAVNPPEWLRADNVTLVPVPLHWQRHLQRGFNQAERLAYSLGKQLEVPVSKACRRLQNSQPQHELKRKQRLKNLRNKFTVVQPVANQHIVLIDDVMTTGATLFELSRILLLAGAKRVDTLTLARTP